MRARLPDADGYVDRNGVKLFYEVFGSGDRTVLFMPTWAIVGSRYWKMQIPSFARYARTITYDPRGHVHSDSPRGPESYSPEQYAADAIAVMDALGVERASVVTLSIGARAGLVLAANHPDRVERIVFNCPAVPFGEAPDTRQSFPFEAELDTDEGWAKFNRHYWMRDYEGFLRFFFEKNFTEPHSSKALEDALGWGAETTPEVLADTTLGGLVGFDEERARELASRIRCPVLVIQGSDDGITGPGRGIALAEATGGHLAMIEGGGHGPHARDPVRFNLLVRDFFGLRPLARSHTRWNRRRKRALYVSSPIGLGHARRDAAIADELRKKHPDLEIVWLAQSPVTDVLAQRGETIHPASRLLASEAAHIDDESGEHDLHVFQAFRRMDEILLANFMVFQDLMEDEHFDLVVGDEAWELDHFLHENPELKRAPFVWMTDFVGWLPMPEGGEHEKYLTADYNAEMIEHIDRYPRLRDQSIFVGSPDDIVADTFGANLPSIRAWTEQHFRFAGYTTGFDPAETADREALRARFGFAPDETVCLVTVGGSGVGAPLLRRVIDSYPIAKQKIPGLKMLVVAGPRINPVSLPAHDGMEVRAFVPDLYRQMAACDAAIVQGGLTTCMELTAERRPFLYFPLRNHFEQNFHVPHRLQRYNAGRRMDYAASPPDAIADALVEELARPVDYKPVEYQGAIDAAAMISELL
ncbi:MAG TPA: alpha/beta fold hydrolase [Actinomycetota bacterium]|nr:alpha/beta fold hydrolase [Actinomycetota bacterium]